MKLPSEHHPIWKSLIRSRGQYQFEFLATKILLGRLNLKYRRNQSPQEMKKCVHELWTFFERNSDLPKAQNDLKKIFGKGAR